MQSDANHWDGETYVRHIMDVAPHFAKSRLTKLVTKEAPGNQTWQLKILQL